MILPATKDHALFSQQAKTLAEQPKRIELVRFVFSFKGQKLATVHHVGLNEAKSEFLSHHWGAIQPRIGSLVRVECTAYYEKPTRHSNPKRANEKSRRHHFRNPFLMKGIYKYSPTI